MDIAFDRKSWSQDPAGPAGANPGAPEWEGLRARLTAAREARRVLVEALALGGDAPRGSFDCVSARVLADYGQSQPTVNPVFWADGKPGRSMDAVIADETTSGDRG